MGVERSREPYNSTVGRKCLEESAVPLYELIPDKECISKGWKLSTGATNQDLAFALLDP